MILALLLACARPPGTPWEACLAYLDAVCECGDPSSGYAPGDLCDPTAADIEAHCGEWDPRVCDPASPSWDAARCEEYHAAAPHGEALLPGMTCYADLLVEHCGEDDLPFEQCSEDP
jgi:hypothetical protein